MAAHHLTQGGGGGEWVTTQPTESFVLALKQPGPPAGRRMYVPIIPSVSIRKNVFKFIENIILCPFCVPIHKTKTKKQEKF